MISSGTREGSSPLITSLIAPGTDARAPLRLDAREQIAGNSGDSNSTLISRGEDARSVVAEAA
jgi:hypothetical protein